MAEQAVNPQVSLFKGVFLEENNNEYIAYSIMQDVNDRHGALMGKFKYFKRAGLAELRLTPEGHELYPEFPIRPIWAAGCVDTHGSVFRLVKERKVVGVILWNVGGNELIITQFERKEVAAEAADAA